MDPSVAHDVALSNYQEIPSGITLMCGVDAELGGDPEHIFEKMDAAFGAGAKGISLDTIEGLNIADRRDRL